MKNTVYLMAVCLAVSVGLLAYAAESVQEQPGSDDNLERYVGRELVTHDRAAQAGIMSLLPQSCPPFYLRDEYGRIIGPDSMDPVSTKQTCMRCHDYQTITRGYHFQMGADQLVREEGKLAAKAPVSKGPGYFGKWSPLYQRELAPKFFDNPDAIDLTPFDWIPTLGIYHPGGGPAEFDRVGRRYSDVMGGDAAIAATNDGDYYNAKWHETGVVEADCLICHLDTYDYSLRAQQLKKRNYKWATTAAGGFATVEGGVDKNQIPQVKYDNTLFGLDGKVKLKIRRPADRNCLACHNMIGVERQGTTWHTHYMQDVHTEQKMQCIDCHAGDIRHNFAKGKSVGFTTRDDLDGSGLSCKECHYSGQHGAPRPLHVGFPPLHFKRLSCQACHITKRPMLSARIVDSVTGRAVQLPNKVDMAQAGNIMFGAMWGTVSTVEPDALLDPCASADLKAAAETAVDTGSPMRDAFKDDDGTSRLPDKAFRILDFLSSGGKTPLVDTADKRALMLLALQQKLDKKKGSPVCVFRGKAYQMNRTRLDAMDIRLKPRRVGQIAEYPTTLAYHEVDGQKVIYPEGYQLSVFWAYMDGDTVRPLLLKDMQAAADYLKVNSLTLYPARPAKGEEPAPLPKASEIGDAKYLEAVKACLGAYRESDTHLLGIWDDNFDLWPEVNTEEEIGLEAWAIVRTMKRLPKPDLFYITGTTFKHVSLTDSADPFAAGAEPEPIVAGQPFAAVTREIEKDKKVTRLMKPFTAKVEPGDSAKYPSVAALAKPVEWTIGHGVEPLGQAVGPGLKGCVDCHELNSPFFWNPVVVEPYGPDGAPVVQPNYKTLGFTLDQMKIAHFREVVVKEQGHWILFAVIGILAFHFLFFGPRVYRAGAADPEGSVRFFGFHEIALYWACAGCVTGLLMSAVGFRLTGQTTPGAFMRDAHHYIGILGAFAFTFFALCLLPAMLPGLKTKFSAGEKLLYWALVVTLVGIASTGLYIYYNLDVQTPDQQAMYMVHDVCAVLVVCLMMVHVYMLAFLHPQAILRVFGGRVSRAWATRFRPAWKAIQKS